MLVSGSITNPSLIQEKVNPPQVVAQASSNTTRMNVDAPKSDSSSQDNKPQKANYNLGVEEAVREYFADIPLMIQIAKCESRFRQFDSKGDVVRGIENSNDVGVTQVNTTYHGIRSEKLGYNIYSLQGNMAYARLLYEESGPQPWASSYPCWGGSPLAANFKPRARAVVTTVAAPTAAPASVTAPVTTESKPAETVTAEVKAKVEANLVSQAITGTVSVLAER